MLWDIEKIYLSFFITRPGMSAILIQANRANFLMNPQNLQAFKKRFRYFLGRFRFIRTLGCQFFFVCLLWYSPDTKLCAFGQGVDSGPEAVGQNIAA